MSVYYLHDGRDELGPFSIDLLKKQKLSRNTPVRQMGTDNWMPAEKLAPLKELVAPRKIKKPKDIVPAVKERIADWKERKPVVLYGVLVCIALAAAVSLFSVTNSITKIHTEEIPKAALPVQPEVFANVPNHTEEPSKPKEKEVKLAAPVVKEDKEKATRLQWKKLIAAANSNYGIGFLGGIKDLNIIMTNRTDYLIDEAVAKVTYIKASGGIWKTIMISIYNVPAHDSKEMPVPDVGRGKKVKVSIQKIVSKKMKFSYTEGQKIRNPEDPYVIQ